MRPVPLHSLCGYSPSVWSRQSMCLWSQIQKVASFLELLDAVVGASRWRWRWRQRRLKWSKALSLTPSTQTYLSLRTINMAKAPTKFSGCKLFIYNSFFFPNVRVKLHKEDMRTLCIHEKHCRLGPLSVGTARATPCVMTQESVVTGVSTDYPESSSWKTLHMAWSGCQDMKVINT